MDPRAITASFSHPAHARVMLLDDREAEIQQPELDSMRSPARSIEAGVAKPWTDSTTAGAGAVKSGSRRSAGLIRLSVVLSLALAGRSARGG